VKFKKNLKWFFPLRRVFRKFRYKFQPVNGLHTVKKKRRLFRLVSLQRAYHVKPRLRMFLSESLQFFGGILHPAFTKQADTGAERLLNQIKRNELGDCHEGNLVPFSAGQIAGLLNTLFNSHYVLRYRHLLL